MTSYEYVVVPAPKKAPKVKAAKTPEARFAHALTEVMNAYGAEGWEYLRSDTLPCEERSGFTGTKTVFQNMLVFRRVIEAQVTTYHLPDADMVPTPEMLAAELPPEPPRPAAAPAPRAETPPRLMAAPQSGTAPRLGPAAARVQPFQLSAVERKD